MRARPTRVYAWIFVGLLPAFPVFADDQAPKKDEPKKAAEAPPPPKAEAPKATIAPASETEAKQAQLAMGARFDEVKDKPALKPIADLLTHRKGLLEAWFKAHGERLQAEKPEHSPESEAAELKLEIEKTRALLEQAKKSPDSLLPEPFQVKDSEATKAHESRLVEMKEAIEAARNDLKEQTSQRETLRTEATRGHTAQLTALRTERDKAFQGVTAFNARLDERKAAIASATSDEAREIAREKFTNFEWEARVEIEKLAGIEAKINLATRRLDLGTLQIQAKFTRVQLAECLIQRMEAHYTAMAERQKSDLQNAVKKEETKAAHSNDPVERRKAQRMAQLFELESQVVTYEKAYATSGSVSLQEQMTLADKAVTDYADLKKLLDDGSISPLDALRLKNDFRRIVPERAQIVRTDLARSDLELTTYENALNDAEIDLVNDTRDDLFDRESLLEQIPAKRRAEAKLMLDELEARHRGLLNRRRDILRKLASRAEDTNKYVVKRIDMLDQQYAFIRTHIFWIRDAEPLGASTLAHARDDSIRLTSALAALAIETGDRTLWGRTSPVFILVVIGLIVLPVPLLLAQRALDRFRLAIPNAPESALSLADYKVEGIEG
jgi:potassium efflux system protein